MTKSVSRTAVAAVAAGAAASISPNSALADSAAGDQPYYLSLEGSMIFADPALDKLGGFSGSGLSFNMDDLDTDIGYRGAAAFGRRFNETNDWRVGVAFSEFLKNEGSLDIAPSSGSGSFNFSDATDMSYLVGDLEFGHNIRPSDRFDLRLFAGLRAVNSDHSLDKLGSLSGSSGSGIAFDGTIKTEFLGIGPRAGFDFSSRIGEGGFGISGMAGAAVLFGELEQTMSSTVTSGGSSSGISTSESDDEAIFNFEAALGADFHISDRSVLTIGYRGEYWDNLRGEDKGGSVGPFGSVNQEGDLLSHGPFIRFISNF